MRFLLLYVANIIVYTTNTIGFDHNYLSALEKKATKGINPALFIEIWQLVQPRQRDMTYFLQSNSRQNIYG